MKQRKGEKRIYYGLAVLLVAFIVAGLNDAVRSQAERETVREEKEAENIEEQPDTEQPEEISNPDIRVLIMTNGYADAVHAGVSVSAETGFTLMYGEQQEIFAETEKLDILPDDARFQNGILRLWANEGKLTLESLKRGYGIPSYSGVLELRATAEGIVVINELPVEDYLCGVIPSEMPASYELEALKAQAVCARSFAYRQMSDFGYPEYEAHVDDSTNYQVYGNSEAKETTDQAVRETAGQVVRLDGEPVTTYYFSTSGGKTTSLAAWGEEENEQNRYLRSVEIKDENGDYESSLPWYRWQAVIPIQTLSNLVSLNTGTDIGTLQEIQIQKSSGDVVIQLTAVGDRGTVTVETENRIRRTLGGKGYKIIRQDGSEIDSGRLLPSAFFTLSKDADHFVIHGGGYGHGIGMSQNGANEMAKAGKNYQEILSFFYQNITIS